MSNNRVTGEYILDCFIPYSLPPKNPALQISNSIMEKYGQAMHMLGRLNEMMNRIPDKERFLKAYIWKEAILTSEIEGIHTTLLDILTQSFDIRLSHNNDSKEIVSRKNVQLVINYSNALRHAVHLIQKEEMPIVSRILKEAHAKLLQGEGDHSNPGQYRRLQVKVGSLTPAPASHINNLISDLENFINNDTTTLPLVKAGLAHVQFETIHPFLDGNGRIGRLLIILMLIKDNLLSQPLLYPSYFFKKYHSEYYERLDAVRTKGDFEGWIEYYLRAITESAEDATYKAIKIEQLERNALQDIKSSGLFIRSTNEAIDLLNHLFKNPIVSITMLADVLDKPYNSIKMLIEKFVKLGLLYPVYNNFTKRNKAYVFKKYVRLINI